MAETNRSEMGRRNGGAVVSAQPSERMLLLNLLARLHELDADVYVGHNISAFDLDVLLHRLQFHKVPTSSARLAQTLALVPANCHCRKLVCQAADR